MSNRLLSSSSFFLRLLSFQHFQHSSCWSLFDGVNCCCYCRAVKWSAVSAKLCLQMCLCCWFDIYSSAWSWSWSWLLLPLSRSNHHYWSVDDGRLDGWLICLLLLMPTTRDCVREVKTDPSIHCFFFFLTEITVYFTAAAEWDIGQ